MDDEPPLHVTRIANEPGRYRVRSQRRGIGHHVVDFTDPEWPLGLCRCEDHVIRIQFPLKNDLEPEKLTCVHINAVNATIAHGRLLCEAAEIPFHINIIPEL